MAPYNKRNSGLLCYIPSASSLLSFELHDRAAAFPEAGILCVDGACRTHNVFRGSRFIVSNTSNPALTELRIAIAYVKLSSIPGDITQASVSLASIGDCEIRMFRGPEVDFDGTPLFWLELFDHSTKTSLDGIGCHRIKDAAPIFEDFMSQADRLKHTRSGRRC